MQVSQLAELDTHAVIGGGKARSFSMSDSAEFFTVLSDTLYRDKQRAVVREVICNGWDAHVMNGCTDKALEITITDDEMIIKDFGPGISDDRIVPIYCVYGASTKVKDDAQTGGFGLGSKAPFAYTDHFTVISCFEGKKIVYAISRGGTATEGKPEIRQMVAVPTQETGITVTIPLRGKEDRYKFASIIRSVAYQGGMKVCLNGDTLTTVNYDQARKRGYCAILNRGEELREALVYLLYGTVLYPVSTTDRSIMAEANQAYSLIGDGYKLVLIAPPNSIGVTPSRESLSYSEMTTGTILRLLKRATNEIKSSIKGAGKKVITRIGAKMTFDDAHASLSRSLHSFNEGLIQVDPRQIAAYAVKRNFDRIDSSQRRKWIFSGLIKNNRDKRAILRNARHRNIDFSAMRREHGHRQFVKFASRLGALDEAMIYSDHFEITRGSKRLKSLREAIEPEGKFIPRLYIAPNKRELTSLIVSCKLDPIDRAKEFHMGLITGPKPSRDKLDRIRKLAAKFKFSLEEYDFEWERPKVVRTKRSQEKFHNLDDYVEDRGLIEATLTNPKFFMRAATHNDVMRLGIKDYSARHMLKNLFPGIAVITTKQQEEKLRKAGAVNIAEEIIKRLQKLGKSREVQYGLTVQDHGFVQGAFGRFASSVGDVAIELAKLHPDIAKTIFPDRVTIGEVWKEARQLIRILRTFPADQDLQLPKGIHHPEGVIAEIETAARKSLGHLMVRQIEADKKFAYLSMLVGSSWLETKSLLDEEKRAKLIGVIRYLQRSTSKSKLTYAASAVAMKEAA